MRRDSSRLSWRGPRPGPIGPTVTERRRFLGTSWPEWSALSGTARRGCRWDSGCSASRTGIATAPWRSMWPSRHATSRRCRATSTSRSGGAGAASRSIIAALLVHVRLLVTRIRIDRWASRRLGGVHGNGPLGAAVPAGPGVGVGGAGHPADTIGPPPWGIELRTCSGPAPDLLITRCLRPSGYDRY